MATTIISPNMSLVIPIVGQEPGPQFATDVNSSLTIIDQHNHTPGYGVQIPPQGLNINSALTFNNNFATNLAGLTLIPQNSTPANNTVYENGVDLYYRDGNGVAIPITSGGHVNSGAGSINGLPSGTASASYNSGSGTFVFQSSTSTSANIDGGSFIFRNNTSSSHGLTLSPPAAMSADYTLVLPAIPGSTSFLTLDTSGNISGSISTSAGITGSNIAAATITGSNIAATTITASNIANSTITGTQIANNVNLPGIPFGASKPLVISFNGAEPTNLEVMRGFVAANGSIISGTGFTCVQTGTGTYSLAFTASFGDQPAIVVTPFFSGLPVSATVTATTASSFTVILFTTNAALPGGLTNSDFSFICIGSR